MNYLLRLIKNFDLINKIIVVLAIIISCSAGAEEITAIYRNVEFSYGTYHVYVLSNNDYVEVLAGAVKNLKDPNVIGQPEPSADNWQVGEKVQRVAVKERYFAHGDFGGWKEADVAVLVNRDRNNAYLRINRYVNSPSRNWKGGQIDDIGFKEPSLGAEVTWVRTGSHGLMIAHPSLNLDGWRAGDSVRFKEQSSTHGKSWTLFNETVGSFAYPFWIISEEPWSPASYRVLSHHEKNGYTYIELDYGLKLKAARGKKGKKPLFSVGDFAIVKIKKQTGKKGSGIVLVHPTTGEEIFVRADNDFRGLWGVSNEDSNGTFTVHNNPYRWQVKDASDLAIVTSWNGFVIAVNGTNDGFVLLDADDFRMNDELLQPTEKDAYSVIPVRDPQWNTDASNEYYNDAFEGPFLYRLLF